MANKNLELLLNEYEQKRRKAEMDLDDRKSKLYNRVPRLEEIDIQINKIAIGKAKSILANSNNIPKLNKELELLKKEKKDILKKEGIDTSFFEPIYECNICKDTGYILDKNNQTIMCNCLKQNILNSLYNQSNLSNIDKENFDNFNENLFSSETVTGYGGSPKENIINIKNASLKFIENFDDLNGKNLLFSGNTGLGKSYMSNCIANELLKKGKTVLYQTAPVLLETIIDNKFNKYKTTDTNNFYNNVLTVDLLIIDDLGTEYLNSMKLSELFTILNTRILNLNRKITKTIISTNLNVKQIFKIYEERIGSRLVKYYDWFQFFGEDLRLKH